MQVYVPVSDRNEQLSKICQNSYYVYHNCAVHSNGPYEAKVS